MRAFLIALLVMAGASPGVAADLKLLTAVAAIVGPVLDRAKSAEQSTPTPVAER